MPKKLVYEDKNGVDVPLDAKLVQRLINVVNRGLSSGLGKQQPGFMCVEAAVNYALGRNHSDSPPCVGLEPREAKIELNDTGGWSSKKARAKGLLAIAVAQLGSETIDQIKFVSVLKDVIKRRIVKVYKKKINSAFKSDEFAVHEERLERERSSDYVVSRACSMMGIVGQVKDVELTLVADCILDTLKKLKSPGVKFLGLINKT